MLLAKPEISKMSQQKTPGFTVFDVRSFWLFFGGYKTFFSLFAFFVYNKFSSLGDTDQYINGWSGITAESFYKPTQMMETFGGLIGVITRYSWLANIPFLLLSMYGTWYALKRLRLSRNQALIILILLLLPTYNIWTGIVSKESVGNFFMGVIAGYFIDIYRDKRLLPNILEIVAFYLAAVFKPQYLIALAHVWVILALARRLNGKFILFIGLVLFGLDIYLLYFNREIIGEFSLVMEIFFDPMAASTRPNDIWVQKFDVFTNAPYGMLIAFVGPTLREAMDKPLQMMVFIESLFILAVMLLIIGKMAYRNVVAGTFSPARFFMLFFSFLWLMAVHYPFGALNPGSAVRYRENFYLYLVVMLIFCLSTNGKKYSNASIDLASD